MRNPTRPLLFAVAVLVLASSCSMFRKKGEGCPSDGRNVGAEKLLNEPPKKKAKWRGPKSYDY
ncbi:MAG: hypothetical protein EOO12_14845 [Chitinophagaceae bacterium]|nr:MAG: hypothetical protein EOO12_14845 [Chitinophagaceae bacterium]